MGYAFISYSTKNQLSADAMKKLLNDNQIDTWMAPGDIPTGSSYLSEINVALKNCSCLVLLLSEASQHSEWVTKEVERAISYSKMVLPVQIEAVTLNDEFEMALSKCQIRAIPKIDKRNKDVKELVATVKAITNKEAPDEIPEKTPRAVEKPEPAPVPAPEKEEKSFREVLAEKECLVHDAALAVTFLISVLGAVLMFLSRGRFYAAADTEALIGAKIMLGIGAMAGIIALAAAVIFLLEKRRMEYSKAGVCAEVGSLIGSAVCVIAAIAAVTSGLPDANAVYHDEENGIRYVAYDEGLELAGIGASEAVIRPEYQGMKIVKFAGKFAENAETLTFTGGEFLLDGNTPVFSAPKLKTLKIVDASFTAVDAAFYQCTIQNLLVENGTFRLTDGFSEGQNKTLDFLDKLDFLNLTKEPINRDAPLFCGGLALNVSLDRGVLENWGSRILQLDVKGEGNAIYRQEREDWPDIDAVNFAEGTDFGDGFTLVRNADGGAYFSGVSKIGKVSLPVSVTVIPDGFFGEEAHTILYAGTEEQWEKIRIGKEGNEFLQNGTKEITFGAAD